MEEIRKRQKEEASRLPVEQRDEIKAEMAAVFKTQDQTLIRDLLNKYQEDFNNAK